MSRIVPGIDALGQHLALVTSHPEAYRPRCCPHCGMGGMWRHGGYERKAPRGERLAFSLGPVFIPRFRGGKRKSFTSKAFSRALKRAGVAAPRLSEKRHQHRVHA